MCPKPQLLVPLAMTSGKNTEKTVRWALKGTVSVPVTSASSVYSDEVLSVNVNNVAATKMPGGNPFRENQ